MKVLLVSPYFIDSYANKLSMGSAVKLARNLAEVAEVVVLTTGRKIQEEMPQKNLKIISVDGFLIPDPINYMISFGLLKKFIDLVRSFKPEVVVVSKYMFFSSLVIPIARLMGVVVITVTDTFPGINWFPVSRLAAVVMWIYARIIGLPLLWMSNKVVVLYRGLGDIAKKCHLNYIVIPNGIERRYFGRLPVPEDFKKAKGEFWVGYVGRPESVKGYDKLLVLTRKFLKNKKVKFVIAGGGGKPGVRRNKLFLGFRQDIMNIYQLFDVLVLPSHAEGLPNVVMEAMAQGVPVISNRVGGVVELIEDGKDGFLVDNVEEMEGRIRELLADENLRRNVGDRARLKLEKTFVWEKIIDSYQKLMSELCVG